MEIFYIAHNASVDVLAVYGKYTDEQILLYRSAAWEKAQELYKEAIGVERKVEFGDELEQKMREAGQKKENAERKLARLAKKK